MEQLAIVPILGVLLVAHEAGHFVTARMAGIVVEEFAIGFPPRVFSRVIGGVRYSLNALPLGAYVKMLGEEDPSSPGSFASKPLPHRALVLAAGSLVNLGAAVLIFAIAYATGWPDPSAIQIRVTEVAPDSPAQRAGLRPGDTVRFLDGREIHLPGELREWVQQRLGEPTELMVERNGQRVTLSIVPRTGWPEGQGPLGVRLQARALPLPHDPFSSLAFGVRHTFQVIGLTLSLPAMVIRGEVPLELARPLGLPGMTQLAAEATTAVVESGWIFPVLLLAGVFSAGMAVANLLPLPALDGGRLLFVVIEAIRGQRVPPEREGLIHMAGLLVLVSLLVGISLYELVEPPPSIDWGLR